MASTESTGRSGVAGGRGRGRRGGAARGRGGAARGDGVGRGGGAGRGSGHAGARGGRGGGAERGRGRGGRGGGAPGPVWAGPVWVEFGDGFIPVHERPATLARRGGSGVDPNADPAYMHWLHHVLTSGEYNDDGSFIAPPTPPQSGLSSQASS